MFSKHKIFNASFATQRGRVRGTEKMGKKLQRDLSSHCDFCLRCSFGEFERMECAWHELYVVTATLLNCIFSSIAIVSFSHVYAKMDTYALSHDDQVRRIRSCLGNLVRCKNAERPLLRFISRLHFAFSMHSSHLF